MQRLVAATDGVGVAALFGIGERDGDEFYITQVYAWGGRILGMQRNRHLGEDEEGHAILKESTQFELGSFRIAAVICPEARVDFTWDAAVSAGVQAVFMCSAPGLHGRRTDEAAWRDGFEWWESCGLADARGHAKRLGLWGWWVPPGGGIEPGEDDLAAAHRELLEELGRGDLEIGPPIGARGGTFQLDERWVTQNERWYLCRCRHFDLDLQAIAAVRGEGIRDLRWWSSEQIRSAEITTGPRDLADLLDAIAVGRLPDRDVDLGF